MDLPFSTRFQNFYSRDFSSISYYSLIDRFFLSNNLFVFLLFLFAFQI